MCLPRASYRATTVALCERLLDLIVSVRRSLFG